MELLIYRGLDTDTIPGYAKLAGYLAAEDFGSADVKKVGDNLYRARLDRSNRLLFSLYRHGEERYALILEYIHQHAYEKSRFLAHGATIDEDKIPSLTVEAVEQAPQLPYVNPGSHRFHLLDKVLSFDDDQELIYRQSPPLIVIGSAGSGKTALTLEKMKDAVGDILYVTRSVSASRSMAPSCARRSTSSSSAICASSTSRGGSTPIWSATPGSPRSSRATTSWSSTRFRT